MPLGKLSPTTIILAKEHGTAASSIAGQKFSYIEEDELGGCRHNQQVLCPAMAHQEIPKHCTLSNEIAMR